VNKLSIANISGQLSWLRLYCAYCCGGQ